MGFVVGLNKSVSYEQLYLHTVSQSK